MPKNVKIKKERLGFRQVTLFRFSSGITGRFWKKKSLVFEEPDFSMM